MHLVAYDDRDMTLRVAVGVKVVDDLTLSVIRQKEMLMSGTIIVGLITLGTNYIQDEFM